MSEPTNSASGVEPAADTLFADLKNTQPPYDPEYDAHIPPEDSSAPEEDPFAHESFMPELNPEAVNAQTVTAYEDALGEFMPFAYRVGGYGSEYNPEDPYGERTYSLSTIDPATLIDGLNDRQREAVLHAGSPLLIVARAGSGKTRVLTHRIAHLLATERATPGQILAITFTNKEKPLKIQHFREFRLT